MSSKGRSVRVRGEKREQLDVARFARAVLALHAQMLQEAKTVAETQVGEASGKPNGGSDASAIDATEAEAEP